MSSQLDPSVSSSLLQGGVCLPVWEVCLHKVHGLPVQASLWKGKCGGSSEWQ